MTTTLTARVPADLLAAVPLVLGFRPSDSLVMLTFDAAHAFHARVDLPPPGQPDSLTVLVDLLLAPALAHGVRRVAFVSYSADALGSARLGAALRRAFTAAGIDVIDVLRAHAGAWCRVPTRPGRRETRPVPYDDESHPFAAQAVFEGLVTHASRDDLRDTVAAVPVAVARVSRLQAGSAGMPSADVGWVLDLVTRCVAARVTPDDAEAARALEAVVRAEVRDAVVCAVTRESAPDHLQVWSDLLRRAPEPQVPDAAAVTAFCAWQSGHGALAWCALDRCLDLDPEHGLGRCLEACLTQAVPPAAWEEAGERGSPRSRPARPHGARQVRPP